MIYLDILGRCGNQMFQFAFAKRIAEIQNDSITVNIRLLKDYAARMNDVSFISNELNFLRCSEEYTEADTDILKVFELGSKRQKRAFRVYKLFRKIFGAFGIDPHKAEKLFRFFLARRGVFLDCLLEAKPFELKRISEKNIFIKGYFEKPIYFELISDELRKLFQPSEPLKDEVKMLQERLLAFNSVCVSFRKWEVGGREICGAEYYKNAFDYIGKHVEDPLFFICSNDVEWVKVNFDLPENCVFESGENTISEKIALMSSCHHFIISNSTFPWWVQFLSKEKDKIVVSPSHWFENEEKSHPLIIETFVKI